MTSDHGRAAVSPSPSFRAHSTPASRERGWVKVCAAAMPDKKPRNEPDFAKNHDRRHQRRIEAAMAPFFIQQKFRRPGLQQRSAWRTSRGSSSRSTRRIRWREDVPGGIGNRDGLLLPFISVTYTADRNSVCRWSFAGAAHRNFGRQASFDLRARLSSLPCD